MKTITEEPTFEMETRNIQKEFQEGIFDALPEIVKIAKGSARKRIERMLRDGTIVPLDTQPDFTEQISAFDSLCKYGLVQTTTKNRNLDDGNTEKIVYTFG